MADWWYYGSQDGRQVNPLWELEQIINNIRPLNDAIANMTLSEAVQYIADKFDNGSPVGNLIVKFVENFKDTEETETDTYVIGSVNQGGGGRSGGGGAGRTGDASEVWDEYINDEKGYVSVFGNATETEEAIPYLVLLSKGNILSLGVQLFLPQSAAIAALLPYAGLATTEEFWLDSAEQALEIGMEILEFTYRGIPIKGLVPAIMDLDRQIWLDNAMMEKLKAFLSKTWKSEYIASTVFSEVASAFPAYISSSLFYYSHEYSPGYRLWTYCEYISGFKKIALYNASKVDDYYNGLGCAIIASDVPGNVVRKAGSSDNSKEEAYTKFLSNPEMRTETLYSYTYNNKTVYYQYEPIGFSNVTNHIEFFTGVPNIKPYNSDVYYVNTRLIAWTMMYGDIQTPDMPAGISTRPTFTTSIPYPPFVLKDSGSLNLRQLTPITLPENQPWLTSPSDPDTASTDSAIEPFLWPSVNQNEFVPYDPDEYPDMAYDPESATAPLPTPQNVPATQPIENPSSPGTPEISYDPSIFDPPFSGGISPAIGVPDPLDWPSAVPGDTSGTHNGDPGLIHVYNPSNTEMQSFGRWLWVTYNDVTLNKIFNNPFDGVIGAHELYATPASVGVKEKIRSGFLVSDVDAYPVLVRYTNIDCGSIVIPEYWGNYLDYAPYTKVHVYLPFIGIVELEADDIIGHSVNINYAIDSYTGACIAQITVAKDDYVNTIYEFQGNCAVEVPITGGSQASIKAGLITAAAYGISGLIGTVGNVVSGATGGAALGTGGAIAGGILGGLEGLGQTAANAINNVVSLKSSVQHSGTFGSSFGAMGIKKPYIIVKRPIQKVVANYNQDYGFPAHKQVVIGQCQGYLKVLEINVISPTATNDEKAQIEALLKQGVYVS